MLFFLPDGNEFLSLMGLPKYESVSFCMETEISRRECVLMKSWKRDSTFSSKSNSTDLLVFTIPKLAFFLK